MSAKFEQLEAAPGRQTEEVGQLKGQVEHLHEVLEGLNKEILRLRDVTIGKEAELATALGHKAELETMLGRYANLEGRLNDVLSSTSWKLAWAAGAPVRKLRERKGE